MRTSKLILLYFVCGLTIPPIACPAEVNVVDDEDNGSELVVGSPVETARPNANHTPAFAGQTRIGGVKTTTSIQATAISSELTSPWGITSLPDGRLLITQKSGQLRIAATAGEVSSPITGLPSVNPAGQAQFSLAWLLAQKPFMVPIPGTVSPQHLAENLGALEVKFTHTELSEISAEIANVKLLGVRTPDSALVDQ